MPEDRLGVHLRLQRRQPRVHCIAIVEPVCRCSVVSRIHIIQIRTKRRLRLRVDDGAVQAVDKADRVGIISPVLEHPKTVSVIVRSEARVFGVDGRSRATIEIDDNVVLDRPGSLQVVEEDAEGIGTKASGFGNSNGFGKKVIVLIIASYRGLDAGLTRHLYKVIVPAHRLYCRGSAGESAQELSSNLGIKLSHGAEESTAQAVRAIAVNINAKRDTIVDHRGVLRHVLNVEERVGENALGIEDTIKIELEVGNARWCGAGLKIEIGDNAKGLCRSLNSPEDVRVLG